MIAAVMNKSTLQCGHTDGKQPAIATVVRGVGSRNNHAAAAARRLRPRRPQTEFRHRSVRWFLPLHGLYPKQNPRPSALLLALCLRLDYLHRPCARAQAKALLLASAQTKALVQCEAQASRALALARAQGLRLHRQSRYLAPQLTPLRTTRATAPFREFHPSNPEATGRLVSRPALRHPLHRPTLLSGPRPRRLLSPLPPLLATLSLVTTSQTAAIITSTHIYPKRSPRPATAAVLSHLPHQHPETFQHQQHRPPA